MGNDDTFMKITNQDIYNKIDKFEKQTNKKLEELTIQVMQTNGKVKLNKWISTTALTLALTALGWLITLLLKS